jgi:hypothetical protein
MEIKYFDGNGGGYEYELRGTTTTAVEKKF